MVERNISSPQKQKQQKKVQYQAKLKVVHTSTDVSCDACVVRMEHNTILTIAVSF
jgi:hypothetical protein